MQNIKNSVVQKHLASEGKPQPISVDLTTNGKKHYCLAYLGSKIADESARISFTNWMLTSAKNNPVRTAVVIPTVQGHISYDARPGCMYATMAEWEVVLGTVRDRLKSATEAVAAARIALNGVQTRISAIMPGDVTPMSLIQEETLKSQDLVLAVKTEEETMEMLSICEKATKHETTQVVVPAWVPPKRGFVLVHKCKAVLPKELVSYLVHQVKLRSISIADAFFWEAPLTWPCPLHIDGKSPCKEPMPCWEDLVVGGKDTHRPLPLANSAESLVSEKLSSKSRFNLRDWSLLDRAAYSWYRQVLAWNYNPLLKDYKVPFPATIQDRLFSNTFGKPKTGRQREEKKLKGLVESLSSVIKKEFGLGSILPNDSVGAPSGEAYRVQKEKIDGDLEALHQQIDELKAVVASMGINAQRRDSLAAVSVEEKYSIDNDEISPVQSEQSQDKTSTEDSRPKDELEQVDDDFVYVSWNNIVWAVCSDKDTLAYALADISPSYGLGNLVVAIGPEHPAWPERFKSLPKNFLRRLWLVGLHRTLLPSVDASLEVMPSGQEDTGHPEKVFSYESTDMTKVIVPKAAPVVKPVKGKIPPPPKLPEGKQKVEVSQSSPKGASSEAQKVKPKAKEPVITKVNPLKVESKVPLAEDPLSDDQMKALRRALKLETTPLPDLNGLSGEERKAAFAARRVPRWAIRAVKDDPSAIKKIAQGRLTANSLSSRSSSVERSSAQLEWKALKEKYPGVALKERPFTTDEKSLKKEYIKLVKKWGKDAAGLPKPKGDGRRGSREPSRGRSSSPRSRRPDDRRQGSSIDSDTLIAALAAALLNSRR